MLLFLSDVSGSEILVILLVILVFFGPKSIPGIAKTFGKTIYQIKQASDDLKSEISKSGMDIKKDLNLSGILERTTKDIEDTVVQPIQKEVNEVDKTLNSISYDKNNTIPRRDPIIDDITEEEEGAVPVPVQESSKPTSEG